MDAWLALARLNRRLGSSREAEHCARRMLSIAPSNVTALAEYGAALHCQGRLDEAIKHYEKALQLNDKNGEAHYFFANACLERGLLNQAIHHFYRTLAILPGHIEATNNLSALLTNYGKIEESLRLLNAALKVKPNSFHMLINLARSHLFVGNAAKALEILAEVVRLYPGSAEAGSKYLLCLNYLPQQSPERVYQEHLRWARNHTTNLPRYTGYGDRCQITRPIRIGYVSPDFKNHSVAYFVEPVLANHDRTRFSITCYADVATPDNTTKRLESLSDHWHSTHKLSDNELCEKIRSDSIDILVDLAGHTANNRLAVFARKPAPIAVTYLGYPNTTGLPAIDYRLTDTIADPPEAADKCHTEKLVRLPDGFLCYKPPADAPAASAAQRSNTDGVVFGSLNNLAKVSQELIRTWARILRSVDTSRLFIKSKATADPYTRSQLIHSFDNEGITRDRLSFGAFTRDRAAHLANYNRIDVALDTFPYNGTTTTCEALWMGTPVVTLCGKVHAQRVSASILSQLGLTELIAHSTAEYRDIAIGLAKDPTARMQMHADLRGTMLASPLCDAPRFTMNLENAYTSMWKEYCAHAT
jgi:predicted O-linked N-acetylglucosamine transferase (SPINDLY family)